MKVILFNGSPKKNGCTYTALTEIEKELNNEGIETLIFHAGAATKGCLGCGYCVKNGKCITDDCVNEAAAGCSILREMNSDLSRAVLWHHAEEAVQLRRLTSFSNIRNLRKCLL